MSEQIERLMLTPDILLKAYACGLFPMSESADDPNLFWVDPDERGVLPLDQFHISKSLKKEIIKGTFEIKINHDFARVMRECAAQAPDRPKTWINETILTLYQNLHEKGHAHSVEAYQNGALVGGLYGVSLNAAFFGESMFTRVSNASKVCLAHLVSHLIDRDFCLLDTQFTTDHLKSLGAIDISRDEYSILLHDAMARGERTFHP